MTGMPVMEYGFLLSISRKLKIVAKLSNKDKMVSLILFSHWVALKLSI